MPPQGKQRRSFNGWQCVDAVDGPKRMLVIANISLDRVPTSLEISDLYCRNPQGVLTTNRSAYSGGNQLWAVAQ